MLLLGNRSSGGLHIAGGTDLLALREDGGWASLAMPRRYVEQAKVQL